VLENGCTTNGNGWAKKRCLNEGFIISKTGVTVGLTSENTKGFAFVKLVLNQSYSADPRDWTQTAGCISVNGAPCKSGSLLFDSGIPQAYLTIPPSVPIKLTTEATQSTSTPQLLEVADGQNIIIYFGSEEPYTTTYNFIVGGNGNDMAPTKVIVT
jgi:hypothetical protein